MRKILSFICLFVFILSGCSAQGKTADISCMSFNVLCYEPEGDYLEASERAPAVVSFLKEQNCDIFGLQEVCNYEGVNWIPGEYIFDWHDAICSALADEYEYRSIADEEHESFAGYPPASLLILYRKDRFELLESGGLQYNYSSGQSYYQWVKLLDKKSKKEIFVTNTHMTPSNVIDAEGMRLSQAEELADFWENTVKDAPLIATGDYNCFEFDEPHLFELQAAGKYMPVNAVAQEEDGGALGYDHIYVNSSVMDVIRFEKLSNEYALGDEIIKMSDHCPVSAFIKY